MANTGYGKFNGRFVTENFGRVGMHTRRGSQVIRKAITDKDDPQSAGQMYQRLKMLTTAPLYSVLRDAIALGWENIPEGQSLYNCFTGMAMRSTPFGITKDLHKKGAGIAWGAQITSGTLPVIAVSNHVSNIVLSGISKIDASTTVGQFADAVVKANPESQSHAVEIFAD